MHKVCACPFLYCFDIGSQFGSSMSRNILWIAWLRCYLFRWWVRALIQTVLSVLYVWLILNAFISKLFVGLWALLIGTAA